MSPNAGQHHTADDRGTIVGVGPVPFLLMSTPTGRISGIVMGRTFFPGVLVQFVRLKGGAVHHAGRCGRVEVGLDALPQGMQLFAGQPSLACQASRGFALGHAAQQQHQGGWSLAAFREDGPRQQGVVALAGPTTVSRKVALRTEQPSRRTSTARAVQAAWV
jgi:hypothetical protein